jgi:hypothetical protein
MAIQDGSLYLIVPIHFAAVHVAVTNAETTYPLRGFWRMFAIVKPTLLNH